MNAKINAQHGNGKFSIRIGRTFDECDFSSAPTRNDYLNRLFAQSVTELLLGIDGEYVDYFFDVNDGLLVTTRIELITYEGNIVVLSDVSLDETKNQGGAA